MLSGLLPEKHTITNYVLKTSMPYQEEMTIYKSRERDIRPWIPNALHSSDTWSWNHHAHR